MLSKLAAAAACAGSVALDAWPPRDAAPRCRLDIPANPPNDEDGAAWVGTEVDWSGEDALSGLEVDDRSRNDASGPDAATGSPCMRACCCCHAATGWAGDGRPGDGAGVAAGCLACGGGDRWARVDPAWGADRAALCCGRCSECVPRPFAPRPAPPPAPLPPSDLGGDVRWGGALLFKRANTPRRLAQPLGLAMGLVRGQGLGADNARWAPRPPDGSPIPSD